MNDRMRLRVNSLSVCSYSRCIWGTSPSNGFAAFGFAIVAEIHLDRRSVGAEVKRLLELFRQFAERQVFIDVKVLHERLLQVPIVRLHSLRPTPPRRDRAFSQSFAPDRKSSARDRKPTGCQVHGKPGMLRGGC